MRDSSGLPSAMICAGCWEMIVPADALCPSCGRFVIADLSDQQKAKRIAARGGGRLILLTIPAWIFGVMLWGAVSSSRDYEGTARHEQTRSDVEAVHAVAEKWVVEHPGQCPTMRRLRDDHELSRGSKLDDPWGHVYRITCGVDGVVRVSSDGSDGRAGTDDDIGSP